MFKGINHILNILIGTFLGAFVGHVLFIMWDYKTHAALYEMRSAPWYTSIIFMGLVTAVLLFIVIFIKMAVKNKIKMAKLEKANKENKSSKESKASKETKEAKEITKADEASEKQE